MENQASKTSSQGAIPISFSYDHEYPSLPTRTRQCNDARRASSHLSVPKAVSGANGHLRLQEPISKANRLYLLQDLYEKNSNADSASELQDYVNELRLKYDATQSSASRRFLWDVGNVDVSRLIRERLPPRVPHSGQFDWIGEDKDDAFPKYLWDSRTQRTIPTAEFQDFSQGYIAVSWTWGRYQEMEFGQKKTRWSGGTKWEVPKVRPEPDRRLDLLHDLKACLKRIKGYRYFWVDVLCINQADEKEKAEEIAKQAKIFSCADGVLCYLWRLQEPRHLKAALEGVGHLLHWALVFGDGSDFATKFDKKAVPETSNDLDSFSKAFDLLRSDYWFSSLWALQEIVLAPSGIWMTRHGHLASINGQLLTTRRMAMIIRLLSWAEKKREAMWKFAKEDYIKRAQISEKDFKELELQHELDENRIGAEVSKAFGSQQSSYQEQSRLQQSTPTSNSSSFYSTTESQIQAQVSPDIVIELLNRNERPSPWVIRRFQREKVLRDEIRTWTTWAFGTACIDVSLTATRAAILVAGTNRDVVDGNSREAALLSALKIQSHPRLLGQCSNGSLFSSPKDEKHLPPLLMNAILEKEGLRLFDIGHYPPRRSTIYPDFNDFDESEWDQTEFKINYTFVKEALEKSSVLPDKSYRVVGTDEIAPKITNTYIQRGEEKIVQVLPGGSVLTNMFPDTPSILNSQVLHFAALYQSYSHDGWHVHPGGTVHIPKGTLIHDIKRNRKSPFQMWIRPNGSQQDDYHIRSSGDLKNICRTQPWLMHLLGQRTVPVIWPKFLFVPLGQTKRSVNSGSNYESPGSSFALVGMPDTIGVVLVAKDNPCGGPTEWYKFGNYVAHGLVKGTLSIEGGIFVTSYLKRSEYSMNPADCDKLKAQAHEYLGKLQRRQSADPEWVRVRHPGLRRTWSKMQTPVRRWSFFKSWSLFPK